MNNPKPITREELVEQLLSTQITTRETDSAAYISYWSAEKLITQVLTAIKPLLIEGVNQIPYLDDDDLITRDEAEQSINDTLDAFMEGKDGQI